MNKISDEYQKDITDELFLDKFNFALADLECEYIAAQKQSDQPILFICGSPRSGTTLITQVLARSDLFNYPDNFVARFWRVPFIGLYVEKLIGLRNPMNRSEGSFESNFGRTTDVLDPHEFTYFWKYWLKPDGNHDVFSESKFNEIDIEGLRQEMNAMISIHNKPMFFKNELILSNPGLMHKIFPNSYFVVIKRDILPNALSIFNARKRYCGSENEWFSTRSSNYEELIKQPVEVQIAGQINGIYDEIAKQSLDFPDRIINITYEELCDNPFKTILKIVQHIGLKKLKIHELESKIPKSFVINKVKFSSEIMKKFETAIESV